MAITKRTLLVRAGGLALATTHMVSRAQSGPISVLIPFSAGGAVDIVARVIGQQLTQALGIAVLVDNRAGAAGTIATALVAKAKPDGNTLLAFHQGITYNAALYDNLPFNTQRDLAPVAIVGVTGNVLVVPASAPFKTMAQFIAYAKAHPGELNYGSAGVGSNGHLAMELLQSAAGIKLTHVPYKGMSQAIADAAGGQIQAVLTTLPAAMPFIQGKRVTPLGTSGLKRAPTLPEVPTIDESGIKGFEYQPWYGFLAPAGTPEPVLERLSKAIVDAARSPEIVKKFAQEGLDVDPVGRQDFIPLFNKDVKRWGDVIRRLNIKA